jgi:pimeloyl-ACP methyl ester carboxylesterase
VLRTLDPYLEMDVSLAGARVPLAVDLDAQIGALRRYVDTQFAKGALIRSEKHMSIAGLYLLEPPRADKTPLALVHGLASDPSTWKRVFERLAQDPVFRQSYQVSLFAYPTGLHFAYSASLLRRSLLKQLTLLEAIGFDAGERPVVLVGHSMGGLLARLQVTRSERVLWSAIFSKSPEELDLSAEDVALLEEVLILEPLPFVRRVVFFSTPHRGSKFADNILGEIGSALIALPQELKDLGERVLLGGSETLTEQVSRRGKIADSVQTLEPDSPLILALDQLEIDLGVVYHSVIGDQGKGDTPESSDGVVPYWSSHLGGAASERIVPSGHGSHHHPEGIEELQRILLEHLDERSSPGSP